MKIKHKLSESAGNDIEPQFPDSAPAEDSGGGESEKSSSSRSRRKKAQPEVFSPKRESVRTVEERLRTLETLPSLKQTPPDTASRVKRVDPAAPPPPLPSPPPAEPTASTFIDRGAPIPAHYGMDRCIALPRDPNWIFVYWELKGGILDRLRFAHSAEVIDNSRWVLRVRTPEAGTHYLVDVDLRAGQWYLKVAPDTRLRIDMGFMDQHGEFVLVLTGNDTATPRPGVSDVVDERWQIVRKELEKLLGVGTDALAIQHAAGNSSSAPQLSRSDLPRAIGLFPGNVIQQDKNSN
jgi:hypothetical protein